MRFPHPLTPAALFFRIAPLKIAINRAAFSMIYDQSSFIARKDCRRDATATGVLSFEHKRATRKSRCRESRRSGDAARDEDWKSRRCTIGRETFTDAVARREDVEWHRRSRRRAVSGSGDDDSVGASPPSYEGGVCWVWQCGGACAPGAGPRPKERAARGERNAPQRPLTSAAHDALSPQSPSQCSAISRDRGRLRPSKR
jgi:hypothetical protein